MAIDEVAIGKFLAGRYTDSGRTGLLPRSLGYTLGCGFNPDTIGLDEIALIMCRRDRQGLAESSWSGTQVAQLDRLAKCLHGLNTFPRLQSANKDGGSHSGRALSLRSNST